EEGGQRLARASGGHDQRVPSGGDRFPALALGTGGLGERSGEPATNEREELRHTGSLYPWNAGVLCRRDPAPARRGCARGGGRTRRLGRGLDARPAWG